MTGLKDNSTPIKTIQKQIEAVRKRNFAGVSFFFYESLWKWGKESENIRNQSFEEIFKRNISRPHISG